MVVTLVQVASDFLDAGRGWDPGLTFYDRKGNQVAQLIASGDAAILLLGSSMSTIEEQKRFVGIWTSPDGTRLYLAHKNDAADLTLLPDRGVVLRVGRKEMFKPNEKAGAELALQADKGSRLTLSDKAGKVIWSAP